MLSVLSETPKFMVNTLTSLQVCYQTGNFLAIVVNGIPLAKERTQPYVTISVLLYLA